MSPRPLVTLRARTAADADVLYALSADLETWEEREPSSPAPVTRAAFDARLDRIDAASDRDVQFVVEVDGAPVGQVSLFGIDSLAHHAEVGISLIAEARGRGIGTEALGQLVEFAFSRCNLRRVHLQAIASNLGALRSYEKVGFREEGRLREHAWVRGRYEDIVLMGILRSDDGRPSGM